MKSDAIINGVKIELSENERKAAEHFHKNRYAFAWVRGKLVFNTPGDDRDHQHWLCEDYSLTEEQWENVNRGYMIPGRIQLFKGSNFRELNTDEISVTDFRYLIETHGDKFGIPTVTVYNGVKVGKIGEIWEPISKVGTYQSYNT